jgi:hypothetical protein
MVDSQKKRTFILLNACQQDAKILTICISAKCKIINYLSCPLLMQVMFGDERLSIAHCYVTKIQNTASLQRLLFGLC